MSTLYTKVEHIDSLIKEDESLTLYFTDMNLKQTVVNLSMNQVDNLQNLLRQYFDVRAVRNVERKYPELIEKLIKQAKE